MGYLLGTLFAKSLKEQQSTYFLDCTKMLCKRISDVDWRNGAFALSECVNVECNSAAGSTDGAISDICMLCSSERVSVCGLLCL